MNDTHSSTFDRFLKCYKVLFAGLLIFSCTMTVYFALTTQFSDAGETLRSALIFAVLLWVGINVRWIEARIKQRA